jgi:hypothetical protein
VKEQRAIDAAGGVENTNNVRNEIRPERMKEAVDQARKKSWFCWWF